MQIAPTGIQNNSELSPTLNGTPAAGALNSFEQQFQSAIDGFLGISTRTAAAQESGAGQATVTTQPAVPQAAATTSEDKANMTPTDAYWAEQPAPVQVLRYTPDDQRYEVAQQLASEGYTIDVPIMVLGWDPLATMIERQTGGYTWVPSALQPNVQEAPNMGMPGATPYDPNSPPLGSIQVSTAFADGTNMKDAVAQLWIQGEAATANSGNTIGS